GNEKRLSSSSLRIPNIIYELHGGKLSLVDIASSPSLALLALETARWLSHDSTDHDMMQVMEGFALPTRELARK
ncbi:hypothetical protein H9L39_18569, partial [Fusarium oxysporum f. sp. albedinis]